MRIASVRGDRRRRPTGAVPTTIRNRAGQRQAASGGDHAGNTGWAEYLAGFHTEHPGITEAVLGRARHAGMDPYDWLAAEIPHDRRVLDVACGNGVVRPRLRPRRYLGVDSATAELQAARRRGVRKVACADATRLPLPEESVDIVACSMALMLLPLEETLREIRRVLAPRGSLVATLPADQPLTFADRRRYARLLLALRRRSLSYPNDEALAQPERVFASAGLRLVGDRSRRFAYPIREQEDGRRLVRSLYLPGIETARLAAGSRVAERWVGADVGVPIRMVTALAES